MVEGGQAGQAGQGYRPARLSLQALFMLVLVSEWQCFGAGEPFHKSKRVHALNTREPRQTNENNVEPAEASGKRGCFMALSWHPLDCERCTSKPSQEAECAGKASCAYNITQRGDVGNRRVVRVASIQPKPVDNAMCK